jgi:hypothetical protein
MLRYGALSALVTGNRAAAPLIRSSSPLAPASRSAGTGFPLKVCRVLQVRRVTRRTNVPDRWFRPRPTASPESPYFPPDTFKRNPVSVLSGGIGQWAARGRWSALISHLATGYRLLPGTRVHHPRTLPRLEGLRAEKMRWRRAAQAVCPQPDSPFTALVGIDGLRLHLRRIRVILSD